MKKVKLLLLWIDLPMIYATLLASQNRSKGAILRQNQGKLSKVDALRSYLRAIKAKINGNVWLFDDIYRFHVS